jgi:hypothetical protein
MVMSRTSASAILTAAVFAAGMLWSQPATALTIHVVYDADGPGAVDPCSDETYTNDEGEAHQGPLKACEGGVDRTEDLQRIVEAAAEFYAGVFEDAHEVTISFWWLGPFETLPDARVLERDESERPIEARMRFPANINYFYDPTPHLDEEFTMRPRLYRTTHPAEQMGAFDGTPPEILEVSYVGRKPPGMASDLVTQVLHEMGHALGLSGGPVVGPGPGCHGTDDPFFRPDPALMGGTPVGIRAFHNDSPGQQCVHLELGGIQECKTNPDHTAGGQPNVESTLPGFTLWECASHQALFWVSEFPLARTRPGTVDLLALSRAGGWQDINLPRKYTIGPGDWAAASTWLGNRAPGATDDVYIVNKIAGSKIWDTPAYGAQAASLYISENNTLRVIGSPLTIDNALRIAGPDSEHGPLRLPEESGGTGDDDVAATLLTRVQIGTAGGASGTLAARHAAVEPGAVLQLLSDSGAVFATLDNRNVILGNGTIEVLSLLENFGRIRAFGGVLTIATPEPPEDSLVFIPPTLDLRGHIFAVDGDVIIDGIIGPTVKSNITVGGGRLLHFTNGWEQAPFLLASQLLFDGETEEARVSGVSLLNNLVRVTGLGRFTHNTTFSPTSRLEMTIGGPEPGTGHSMLTVSQAAQLGGQLQVVLTDGFTPTPAESFIMLSYQSRTGEFDQVLLPALAGGLEFLVIYEDNQLRLLVAFEGVDPGAPNCQGAAVSSQSQLHGGLNNAASFHGFASVQEFQQAIQQFCASG